MGAEFVNPDKHVHGIPLPWPEFTLHVQRSLNYVEYTIERENCPEEGTCVLGFTLERSADSTPTFEHIGFNVEAVLMRARGGGMCSGENGSDFSNGADVDVVEQ